MECADRADLELSNLRRLSVLNSDGLTGQTHPFPREELYVIVSRVHAAEKEASILSDISDEVIVTAVGINRPGVLAEVTGAIAACRGNIMDISQKMLRDYFNLIMLVDLGGARVDFAGFKEKLEGLGSDKGYEIAVRHSEVFQYMHRI